MRPKYFHVRVFLLITFAATSLCRAQMTVVPDKPGGVYPVGDTVHWKIEWKGESNAPAAHYTLKSGGLKEVGQGDLSFSNNIAGIVTRFDAPGTMLVVVKWQPENATDRAVGGAVAAPDKILPAASMPAGFDSFWKAKLKELKKVPTDPKLEAESSGKSGVAYWKITMNNIRGTHIQGQIARPEKGKQFPALLIVQWAGVYGLQKSWVTDRAAEGWLALNLEPHDLPIDEPAEFYQNQFAGPLKDYWSIGDDNRDTSYFLRMYLSCYRAIEYLKTRPDWNGKTLVVMGDSQGGQQTIMIAGLHPRDITAALALVPANGDTLAPDIGRAPGWPHWYFNTEGKDPAKVHEASRYYDIANFARHIKCPMLVGLGLRDETCPPSSVLAAVNEMTSPKEVVILPKSGHQDEHGTQSDYNRRRYGGWLPALRQGRPAPVEQP
ncbi:MAG TPA: acetylxylan esterase [Candidatus Limnocylindrales bacterium]|nr:acetylxylan esterase [Candidatus Limnocylindrales bacterium]